MRTIGTLIFPLLIYFPIFSQNNLVYELEVSDSVMMLNGSYNNMILKEDGRFEFKTGLCMARFFSEGSWIINNDTLILNSNRKKGDFIPQIAEVLESQKTKKGVSASFNLYVDDVNGKTTLLMGQSNIELFIFSEEEIINGRTDSSGEFYSDEVISIDSMLIVGFCDYASWKIVPQNPTINSIEVRIDLAEIFFKETEYQWFRYFENEKWLIREDRIINLNSNTSYKRSFEDK